MTITTEQQKTDTEAAIQRPPFKVADLRLADLGRKEIRLAEQEMPGLMALRQKFGDTKSLACHPSSTTHRALTDEEQAAMGLDRSWIRFSVGLEDPDDLEADVVNALNSV